MDANNASKDGDGVRKGGNANLIKRIQSIVLGITTEKNVIVMSECYGMY